MRGPPARRIALSQEELGRVQKLLASRTGEVRVSDRCKIFLLSHEGHGTSVIAEKVGLDFSTVRRRLAEFRIRGLDAIHDRPRSGRPRRFSPGRPC